MAVAGLHNPTTRQAPAPANRTGGGRGERGEGGEHTISRRARLLRENLTAYLFISPALLLIFVFGLYPVAFAFFVSLHRWRRFPGEYEGLSNYARALGDFAYVVFFWLALGAFVYAISQLIQLWKSPAQSHPQQNRLRALAFLLPGGVVAAAALMFIQWATLLLPIILNIPQRIRGQERVQGLFVQELFASFQFPDAAAAGNQFLLGLIAACLIAGLWLALVRQPTAAGRRGEAMTGALYQSAAAVFFVAIGVLTLGLVFSKIEAAVQTARETGAGLSIPVQIILISGGAALLGAAYWLWRRAVRATRDSGFVFKAIAAILLAGGGLLLATVLPTALAEADPDALRGMVITVGFAIATVPLQLGIGLGLAVLLFQNIRGKAFFRIVYFMPYIMPFVATSIVFNLLFSFRPTSLANQFLNAFGIADQQWLSESTGIIHLLFPGAPGWLAGPSLALIVIILYTVWTYIGYDAVVFLAGLGTIPRELYEAARIDGATEWALFRRITLPLLSPTTFFLTLIAISGTFRAFTQIWVMRNPASQQSVDTFGVYIFETVRSNDPNMGYGSALAFVLFGVILILTVIQNRAAAERVHYG